jgi:hypothetical protein
MANASIMLDTMAQTIMPISVAPRASSGGASNFVGLTPVIQDMSDIESFYDYNLANSNLVTMFSSVYADTK